MAESLDKMRMRLEAAAYEKHRKNIMRNADMPRQYKESFYGAVMADADAQVMLEESKRALAKARKKKK